MGARQVAGMLAPRHMDGGAPGERTWPGQASLPETLWHGLRQAELESQHGLLFYDGRTTRKRSWAELARQARAAASQMVAAGLTPGARLLIVTGDPEQFVCAFLGAIACRALPVALAPQSPLGNLNAAATQLEAVLEQCGVTHIAAGTGASGPAQPDLALASTGARVLSCQALMNAPQLAARPVECDWRPAAPDDICFLQLTSGSTATPRAVAVSHANLIANVAATHASLRSDGQRETGVSWLPLWHDMGLIASIVTPLLARNTHVVIPAQAFAACPRLWLEAVHRHRATVTATTNFGLYLATKRPPRIDDLDLSCLEVVLVGAEPINPRVMRAFAERFAPHGLSEAALCPSYGMAEATLAVSVSQPGRAPVSVHVARDEYERGVHMDAATPGQDSIELLSCGKAIEGHRVAILDAAGEELPRGHVGEIAVAGPSLTAGQFTGAGVEPHPLTAGMLRTGDLGFMHGDELFVSGRRKDLIIIAGRNVHPQLIEWQLAAEGVRSNSVAAFSVPGHATERLVIVAECDDPRSVQELPGRIRSRVQRALGLSVDDVVIVRPWGLPKTSSGKVRRATVRALYLSSELATVA